MSQIGLVEQGAAADQPAEATRNEPNAAASCFCPWLTELWESWFPPRRVMDYQSSRDAAASGLDSSP